MAGVLLFVVKSCRKVYGAVKEMLKNWPYTIRYNNCAQKKKKNINLFTY